MREKIAVITGASSGFGFLTALELARRGFHVIATMRNLEKRHHLLNEAETCGLSKQITIYQLDVACEASLAQFKAHINKIGRVDVLVNNAGFAVGGFTEEIPIDDYRKQFETNVFGAISVAQIVLPIMRKQRSGHIINISSISGLIAFPGLSPYVASKHALEGWSESLRLEVQPFGIHVVLVEPGSYETNIWSTGKHVSEASLHPHSPYYEYMERLEDHLASGSHILGNPSEIAQKIAWIAEHDRPSLRYSLGKGVKFAIFMKHFLPWQLWERLVQKQLK
ncbi:oxidoreductase [Ectobacillus panaciterrae]|uniref:oxidoreductase n=1 Tax=Ectobacillus panaciterrae TaxID=363872 RepID=UPI000406673A|nr:oxidoreductase [Ectobacillus panaciterrae]